MYSTSLDFCICTKNPQKQRRKSGRKYMNTVLDARVNQRRKPNLGLSSHEAVRMTGELILSLRVTSFFVAAAVTFPWSDY